MSAAGEAKIVSRRNILKILAGTAGAVAHRPVSRPATPAWADPSLLPAANLAASLGAPQKVFNADEFRTLTALCEAIIPADEHSPGAKDAGVPFWIDAVLAESDASQRSLWREGLAAIDQAAQKESGARFFACTAGQQEEMLRKVAANEERPVTLEEKFFVELKRAAIDGYYNSQIGIHQDLEYQGNTMLTEFEGCTHEEHGAGKQGSS